MRRRLLPAVLPLFVLLSGRVHAQCAVGPQENFTLEPPPPPPRQSFSRSYVLQQSADLVHWKDVVTYQASAENFDRQAHAEISPRLFTRIQFADDYPADTVAADFDGDGVSDYDEFKQGTDPFSMVMDSNGLPLDWERFHKIRIGTPPFDFTPRDDGSTYLQAFVERKNPVDYYDGQLPVLAAANGDKQIGPRNGVAPQALLVRVTDREGLALRDAPVRFQTSAGLLRASCSGVPSRQLPGRTDDEGEARVYLLTPDDADTACTVTATAGSGDQTARVDFTVRTDDGSGTFVSPFSPTHLVSQGNPDGSLDISWENHAGDATPVVVELKRADGSWAVVATLPGDTTNYHWTPPLR